MDWKKAMRPDEIEEYERAKEATKAAAKVRKRIYDRVRMRLARAAAS